MRKLLHSIAPLLLVLFLIPAASGCTSYKLWQLERELQASASPEVRYVAARIDYNAAKRAAASYCELPTTPAAQVEKILAVVEKADQAVAEMERIRRAGDATDDSYRTAASLIRAARVLLAARVPEEVIRWQ